MKLEVLIACMHNADISIVQQTGITTAALIINQCNIEDYFECIKDDITIRMISTTERGLSKSRNMAISNAVGDICLLCDDDELLCEAYEEIILSTFQKLPQADVIAFKISNQTCRLNGRIQKLSYFQLLKIKSWQIAFRRSSILSKSISFDELMGAGSGNGAQEENKFLIDCYKAKLSIYYAPFAIASVAQKQSTWFYGFTEDFFYQRGGATRHMMGLHLSLLYALYYLLFKYPIYRADITMGKAFLSILKGILDNPIAHQKRREAFDSSENYISSK